jgi:hypothetical protein
MTHSFDIDYALKYGVSESIMISNFQFWIQKNKANGTHLHDSRTWTYNSVNAFKDIFPYWNNGQIRRCLESLVKQEVLVKGDYNKNRYERTLWYAFNEESIFLNQQVHLSKTANGDVENGKCITDTIPNSKPDVKPDTKSKPKKSEFIAPTYEQVEAYFLEKGSNRDLAEKSYFHYKDLDWHNKFGKKLVNWKSTMLNNWILKNQNNEPTLEVPPAPTAIDQNLKQKSRQFHETYNFTPNQ